MQWMGDWLTQSIGLGCQMVPKGRGNFSWILKDLGWINLTNQLTKLAPKSKRGREKEQYLFRPWNKIQYAKHLKKHKSFFIGFALNFRG